MKNGDAPAYPVETMWTGDKQVGVQTGNATGFEMGLTKREKIAAMAMQGMLANPSVENFEDGWHVGLSKEAIRHADELLKQLEQ